MLRLVFGPVVKKKVRYVKSSQTDGRTDGRRVAGDKKSSLQPLV